MHSPSSPPFDLQRTHMCYGDSSLIERAGRFRAAMLPKPSPFMLSVGLPDAPVLALEGGDETDPGLLQSIAGPDCVTETCQIELANNYVLLGILISSPSLSLAIVVDPWKPTGHLLLERWHVSGELNLVLCQETGWGNVLEISCTPGVREVLTLPAPQLSGEHICVPAAALKKVPDEMSTELDLENFIVVATSDFELQLHEALFISLAFRMSSSGAFH